MPGSAIQIELVKLENLSTISTHELVMAFRVTIYFRRQVIEKHQPPSLELIQEFPSYITLPQVVCFSYCFCDELNVQIQDVACNTKTG
jgi:hypothetical protein